MKQASRRKKEQDLSPQINRRVKEGVFILLCSLAIYLLIALVTYHHADPAWSHSGMTKEIHNAAGMTGAWFSDVFLSLFGYTAYIFPLVLALGGVFVYRDPPSEEEQSPMWLIRSVGIVLWLIASCGLIAMHVAHPGKAMPMSTGGLLGSAVKSFMVGYMNPVGSTVILLSLCLIGITLFTGFSWLSLLEDLADRCWQFVPVLSEKVQAMLQLGFKKAKDLQLPEWGGNEDPLFDEPLPKSKPKKPIAPTISEKAPEVLFPPAKKLNMIKKLESSALFQPVAKIKEPEKMKAVKPVKIPLIEGLPSLALLEEGEKTTRLGYTSSQLQELSRLVETRLLEFGVEVKVVGVLPGPVITRFELDLAAGLKVSKISGLAKDLARSLSVVSVRVVEVIPGKSVVGLEIPNVHRELVRLKEVLEDVGYQQALSPLSLVLGKDISGKPVIVDLAKMPHLLVAGTTGSGKSVGLNAMLLSILYKATPQQVRMILIDPKMLELAVYDEIPHLLTPVVTDMKDAANALRWCVAEMERRYQIMAKVGVRNLAGYNAKIENATKNGKPILDPLWHPKSNEKPQPLEALPFVVVVVDEFADMIMVVGKKVEELIARIAQKARAAGIHLILATQRPSVDVITGLIKANIPTRIAFQVSSRIDSRTILDQSGAEQLLGHGDMLYLPPGSGVPHRIHGAFVSDEEVNRVAHELRELGKPAYIENVVQSVPSSGSFEAEEDSDELYDQAIAIVTESRKASISLVQRRLKVGYNRAARLIERMEVEGVVSAMQSNGSREVLAAAPPVE